MPKGALEWIVFILITVGTVNIGLAALGFDVVGMIFGVGAFYTVLAVLIGVSGLYNLYNALK